MKRAFDLIISIVALFFLWPVFIVIATLIKLDGQGSVIFKQRRVGKDNKEFEIYKFRSMKENAPEVATTALEKPDDYITPIGKFLRRTSIDELPQLINIIKGEMSLVGPRPLINDESEKVILQKRSELGITKLLPGLTGWAQINGRDNMSNERKLLLEKEYLERHSFLFDIRILFSTAFKVFKQEGIVDGKIKEENASCEERFQGQVKDVI